MPGLKISGKISETIKRQNDDGGGKPATQVLLKWNL
jgi:hypothetical protein